MHESQLLPGDTSINMIGPVEADLAFEEPSVTFGQEELMEKLTATEANVFTLKQEVKSLRESNAFLVKQNSLELLRQTADTVPELAGSEFFSSLFAQAYKEDKIRDLLDLRLTIEDASKLADPSQEIEYFTG